ncbi:hypothetical protein BH09PAT1_BH09PAT1_3120 [soil metagenome]
MKEAVFPISIPNAEVRSRNPVSAEPMLSDLLLKEIHDSHPTLGVYLKIKAKDYSNAYISGIDWMYDIITPALESHNLDIKITSDDIRLHKYDLAEQGIDKITPEDISLYTTQLLPGVSEPLPLDNSPLNNFMTRLHSSSPIVFEGMTAVLRSDLPLEEQRSFIRGAYDTFMPFYRRVESKYLTDHLIHNTYPSDLPAKELC